MTFSKKPVFLPFLLILWLCMPLLTFAQTPDMTDPTDDEINQEESYFDLTSGENESIESYSPVGNGKRLRSIPLISEEEKEKRRQERAEKKLQENITNENNELTKQFTIPNVNTQKVQQAWLSRINHERSTKGLDPLTLDNNLISSSIERADYLASKKQFKNMHSRPGQKVYYDGDLILQRAKDLNLIDSSISTIAESTLFGGYSCKKEDCTDTLIERTRGKTGGPSGFLGFLMGEKKYNGIHYRMMMSSEYTKVGFGFSQTNHPGFGGAYIGVIHFGN